jgi:hypothetical protein
LGLAISRTHGGRNADEKIAGHRGHRHDLAAAPFAVLSLRGLIDPQTASARFGTPVSDIAGSLFYRVYLSRNLVIVVSAVIFLLWRQWTPLAVLLTVTAALPMFDMSALWLSGITPPVFHPIALALIAITAALLWRRAAASPTSSAGPNLDPI